MAGSGGLADWAKREMTALAQDRDRQRARAEKWRKIATGLDAALDDGVGLHEHLAFHRALIEEQDDA